MSRTQYVLFIVCCLVFPYLCAIIAFFASAAIPHSVASIGLVGIPCLLVGTLASQTMAVMQAYGKRIAELEKRLDEKGQA